MASEVDDDRGGRLDAAMAEYLAAIDAGRPLETAAWLAAHPDLAAELASFLDDPEHVGPIVAPFRGAGTSINPCGPGRTASHGDASGPPCCPMTAAATGPASPATAGPLDTAAPTCAMPRVRLGVAEPVVHGQAGRFRLVGEIARGGMGVILKGRDDELGRDLAVKVLLERHGDDPGSIRRFVEEARIAGQLRHPGVVPVYELGAFADRRPYFAMKLVKGRTLAEVMAERPEPSDDHPRLLAIFLDVAQTMAYAHSRGVIHRDLKPSNVMVGSFGEVQVMDWGLAKVLSRADGAAGPGDRVAGASHIEGQQAVIATAGDGSDLSGAGSVMGTPSYMAPEQARGGEVDERSDVFALGSILCEILTGQAAFSGAVPGEILLRAARADTADALARLDSCGADAELVSLASYCLAAGPGDRPNHAGAVADRILGYLAGVQERVRAAEREQAVAQAQAVEERRRRRLQAVLAASVLALAAFGGLGASAYLRQKQDRVAGFERALRESRANLTKASERPDDLAGWREALAVLERVAPTGVEGRARLERLRAEAGAGLGAARRYGDLRRALLWIRSGERDSGDAQSDMAYAGAFREAGLDVDAIREMTAARIRERSPEVAIELAADLDGWSACRRRAGRSNDSWERPLAVARAVDEDLFRGKVRSRLSSKDPRARASGLKDLVNDPKSGDLPAPTAVLLAEALGDPITRVELLRKAVAHHPDDLWVNSHLAEAPDQLRPAQREEVVRYYTAARAIRPESAHPLAHALAEPGRADEAEATFRDLASRRADVGNLDCLGLLLRGHGRPSEADLALDRAIVAGPRDSAHRPDDVRAVHDLGNALRARGESPEAVAAFREALRLRPDSDHNQVHLGEALLLQGKSAEAAEAFREAIRIGPDNAAAHAKLGRILLDQGREAEAVDAFREAVRHSPRDAGFRFQLGRILLTLKKLDPAIVELQKAAALDPREPEFHHFLGHALEGQDHLEEALAAYRTAQKLAHPGSHAEREAADHAGSAERTIEAARRPAADTPREDAKAARVAEPPRAEDPKPRPDGPARVDAPGPGNPPLAALLDDLRRQGKDALARDLEARLDRSKRELARAGAAGHTIFGRVAVAGPDDPKNVQAQMRILDEGYFVSSVGGGAKPVGFRLHGYEPVDLFPRGGPGSIEDVGIIVLPPLEEAGKASLLGKVVLEGRPDAVGARAGISIVTGPINSASGSYEGERGIREPGPLIQIRPDGELSGSGYVPTEHSFYVTAPGYWTEYRSARLQPGHTLDVGTIRLELGDRVTFTSMVATDGSFARAVPVTRTVFGQEFCHIAGERPSGNLEVALFRDRANRVVIHSHRGPFEVVDLGEGPIEEQAKLDHSNARFHNAGGVPAISGHVYLARWEFAKVRVLLRLEREKLTPEAARTIGPSRP